MARVRRPTRILSRSATESALSLGAHATIIEEDEDDVQMSAEQVFMAAMAGEMSLDHVRDLFQVFCESERGRPVRAGLTDTLVSVRVTTQKQRSSMSRAGWIAMLSKAPEERPVVPSRLTRKSARIIFAKNFANSSGKREDMELRFPHFLEALLDVAVKAYPGADVEASACRLVGEYLVPLYRTTMGQDPDMADDEDEARMDITGGAHAAWQGAGRGDAASVASRSVMAARPSDLVLTAEGTMSARIAQQRGLAGMSRRSQSVVRNSAVAAAAANTPRSSGSSVLSSSLGLSRSPVAAIKGRAAKLGRRSFSVRSATSGSGRDLLAGSGSQGRRDTSSSRPGSFSFLHSEHHVTEVEDEDDEDDDDDVSRGATPEHAAAQAPAPAARVSSEGRAAPGSIDAAPKPVAPPGSEPAALSNGHAAPPPAPGAPAPAEARFDDATGFSTGGSGRSTGVALKPSTPRAVVALAASPADARAAADSPPQPTLVAPAPSPLPARPRAIVRQKTPAPATLGSAIADATPERPRTPPPAPPRPSSPVPAAGPADKRLTQAVSRHKRGSLHSPQAMAASSVEAAVIEALGSGALDLSLPGGHELLDALKDVMSALGDAAHRNRELRVRVEEQSARVTQLRNATAQAASED